MMSNLFLCLIIVLIQCLTFINAGISLSLSTASGIAAINTVPDISGDFNISDAFGQLFDDFVQTCNKKMEETFSQAENRRETCEKLMESSINSAVSNIKDNIKPTLFDLNDVVNIAYSYQSPNTIWDVLGEDKGIKVWKARIPISKGLSKGAERWPCVKSSTIINASPEAIMKLLMDSSKVHMTNKYSAGRTDMLKIDDATKMVWARTKIPYSIKPYDFCTLMQVFKLNNGGIMIISKGIEHELVPKHSDYCRSEIYFGVNFLYPLPDDPNRTDFTSISHVRYAGLHPYIASKTVYSATINYLRQLKDVFTNQR